MDADGNVVVAGVEYRPDLGQSLNWLILKYDPNGKELWRRSDNGAANGNDSVDGVAVDGSGRITVVGEEATDPVGWSEHAVIRQYDSDGHERWTRTWDVEPGLLVAANAVAADEQGRLFAAGLSWPLARGEAHRWLLMLYDAEGATLWRGSYASPERKGDTACGVAAGPGGLWIVGGHTDRSVRGRATDWLIRAYRFTDSLR
ncbi:MAG: hypothetical protein AAB368_13580 [bacterium]